MGAVNTYTVGSAAGRDYSTLTAWEAGRQADLVTNDYVELAELYNDSAFLNDSTALFGWTTGASNYIHIYAAFGERHAGVINTGVKFTRSADFTFNSFIQVRENYVRIEGCEFHPYNGVTAGKYGIYVYDQDASNDVRIFNNLFYGDDDSLCEDAIYGGDADLNITIYNNVIYRFRNAANKEGIYIDDANLAIIYNNTVYKCYDGIKSDPATTLAINNAVFECYNTDFSGNFAAASDYNCSSDATAPDNGNSLTNKTDTDNFTNVGAGTEDFHCKGATADIYGTGDDLSSDVNFAFDTDYEWQYRIGDWEIGADQVSGYTTDMSNIVAQRFHSIHKNGLVLITAECHFREIMSDVGDRITIDIGRPKEQFTKALVYEVSRHFLDRYRVTIKALAGGFIEDEDEAWA